MFILMNEEKHMKGYMDYLDRLVSIGKRITDSKTRAELTEIETELQRICDEIDTKMKLLAIPLHEYKELKYITYELEENIRHARRLATLRKEFGYAGINELVKNVLDGSQSACDD